MKNMEYKIVVSSNVKTILSEYTNRYFGYRTPSEYGISAFQFWYFKITNYIQSITNSKLHKINNQYKCKMEFWGVLYVRKIKGLDGIVYSIDNIEIDKVNFYNWIFYHQYPTKSNLPKPERWFRKKIEPLFNKFHIIKIYGKEKYNLLDNSGKIILSEWVEKIKPYKGKSPAGKLKVIAYCNCKGFMSVVTIDGQFIVTEHPWKDWFEESISYNELQQLINEIEFNIRTNLILEQYENALRTLLY